MALNALSSRRRRTSCRHLDVVCVVILTFNILYIVIDLHSSPTLTPHPDRKCPSIRFDHGFNLGDEEKAGPQDGDQDVRLVNGIQVKVADQHVQSLQESGPILKVCPEFPANSRGELICQCDPVTPEVIKSLWPNLEPGGRLRPLTCRPRERLAVIIPFRNRESHLHILIRNLLPILQAQNVDVTFVIVEQLAPSMFNRATLHNIGFLECQKLGTFDCFIFHDVDLIPMDDRILYRCGDNPRHFPPAIKRYGQRDAKKMYSDYFGGVIGLTRTQFTDINGNSNLYFGWGGEDDDLLLRSGVRGNERADYLADVAIITTGPALDRSDVINAMRDTYHKHDYHKHDYNKHDYNKQDYNKQASASLSRVLTKGYKRVREQAEIYKYQMLQHERNDYNRGNIDRNILLKTAVDRQNYEGLSTTTYTVKEIRQEQLYVWISVSLNMTQLLLTAPDYTRRSIKSLIEISRTIT